MKKKFENLAQMKRENRSKKLFNKSEYELNIAERVRLDTYYMIHRIKKGLNWTSISSQYNITDVNNKSDVVSIKEIGHSSTTNERLSKQVV